jgi:hypothetical protein
MLLRINHFALVHLEPPKYPVRGTKGTLRVDKYFACDRQASHNTKTEISSHVDLGTLASL